MLPKCVLHFPEFNWNHRFIDRQTKLNISQHMLTSSTQLQNKSFHVVKRTRTSSKCQKMKNARAKRAKILVFIVKYANLWGFLLPSSSWLLKLPRDPIRSYERCSFVAFLRWKFHHYQLVSYRIFVFYLYC